MKKENLNFEEIFKFAWARTKQHAWFLICSLVIYGVILSAVKFIPIFQMIVSLLVALSTASISLIIVKQESFSFSDLFNRLRSPHLVLKFFGLTIIYGAVVCFFILPFIASSALTISMFLLGGITTINLKLQVLLLVTLLMFLYGVYLSVCFKFYPYVLLENENMKMLDIIKHTYKLTYERFWQLLWFFIIISVLNALGFILFGIGLIITIPVSVFALAHLYRRLEGHIH